MSDFDWCYTWSNSEQKKYIGSIAYENTLKTPDPFLEYIEETNSENRPQSNTGQRPASTLITARDVLLTLLVENILNTDEN
jgi:hypothetical protein